MHTGLIRRPLSHPPVITISQATLKGNQRCAGSNKADHATTEYHWEIKNMLLMHGPSPEFCLTHRRRPRQTRRFLGYE